MISILFLILSFGCLFWAYRIKCDVRLERELLAVEKEFVEKRKKRVEAFFEEANKTFDQAKAHRAHSDKVLEEAKKIILSDAFLAVAFREDQTKT